MREIKFRIWCKQREEMHEVERMGFDNGELWYVEDEDRETEPPYFMDRNDSVLMQYTGLKDKNGTEIFEGDIVKIYGGRVKGFVKFQNAMFDVIEEGGNTSYLAEHDDDIEVIGNIYENPELSEEAK